MWPASAASPGARPAPPGDCARATPLHIYLSISRQLLRPLAETPAQPPSRPAILRPSGIAAILIAS